MTTIWRGIMVALTLVLWAGTAGAQGDKPLKKCAADAVLSGTVCIDKYETMVWRLPDPLGANRSLVAKIQAGRATAAELNAAGATSLGVGGDDYTPCADSGQNCTNDIYAVVVPNGDPAAYITWFQAQQACKNARKRLPTSAEWQAAVAGTPDPGGDNATTDCNTDSVYTRVAAGLRTSCVSADGAYDMVGNLWEWVGDWVPRATACGAWSPGVSLSSDYQCLAGAATTGELGALVRGGNYVGGTSSGPLAVAGSIEPSSSGDSIGFRCVR